MPKLTTSLDTDQKTVSVVLDGQTVQNVSSVNYYVSRDSDGNVSFLDFNFSMSIDNSESDSYTTVTYYSAGSEGAAMAEKQGLAQVNDIKGFIGFREPSKAQKDIANYLSK